ncbi:tape measure protein [Capnocytophaga granulosa]|uniref:tape measure protein n=1 Tax=Capnocytophaga granulosa TaxID=45242 RepID=UPI0023F52CB5|nr:tape measure protein [Capnocytophaga granulosa]
MNNDNGSIDFEARLRLEKLEEGVKEMEKMLNDSMKSSQKETDKLQQSINNLAKGAMAFFTISKAYEFSQKIIAVRSQFQQLEIAFGTMLKSKEKANALMAQMTDLAAKTPFGLQEVSEGAKRLLAFQVPAEEVTETLRRMGDVAAGLGVPMGQLIHVYGQVKAQGKLMTNDLYQFMNAGIPIIAELSKVVGKSETEIKDMVSAGKIGFAEVQAVIKGMTDEGGLFYNLMAEQSKTLSGQLSNLEDNFDNMLNEIGKATEGIASGAISSVAFLVENYQTLGKVIAGLIATYGAYRTAVLVNIALTKGWAVAAKEDAIAKGIQTIATNAATVATKALNAAMKANPYVLVATAVVGLGAAIWALKDNTTAAEKAQQDYNNQKQQAIDWEQQHKQKIDDLIESATNQALADTERQKALIALQNEYPNIFAKYDIESLKLADILKLKQEIAQYDANEKRLNRANEYGKYQDFEKALNKAKTGKRAYDANKLKNSILDEEMTRVFGKSWIHNIDEVEKYIREKQKITKNDYKGDRVAAWSMEVKNLSEEEIKKELEHRQKLIADLQKQKKAGNKWASHGVNFGGDWFAFNEEELQAQSKTLQAQLDKLHEQTYEYKDLTKKYTQAVKDAEVALDTIKNGGKGKHTEEEFAKIIKEAEDNLKNAKKTLEDHKTSLSKSKGAKAAKTKTELPTFDYKKAAQEEARREQDFLFQKEQARINIMEDGAKKRLAIIQLDYDRQEEEIRRRTEDQMAAFIEQQKAQAEAEGKWKRGQAFNEDTTEINAHRAKLQTEEQQLLASNHDYMLYQQEQVYKELLEKYQTYTDQRKAIEEKYNADIAALQAKLGADAPQVKKAQDEKARELKKLDMLYKKEGTAIAKLFENLRKKTVKEIRQTIADVEKEIDQLASMLDMGDKDNVDYIQNLKQQLEQARDTADRSDTVFGKLGTSIKNLFKAKPNTAEWQEAFNGMLSSAQSITSEFGQLGQEFEKLGQSTGNESLKRIGETMQTVSNTLNRTLSMTQAGAQMGGGIGAAIGAVVGLITSGFEMYFKNELEAEKKRYEIAKSKIAQQNEYNRLLFEEKMLHKENISVFGKKELAIANDNLKEYINQRGELKKRISENLYSNKAITVANGTYSTGWGIFEKEGTVWDNLIDVFPQLINKAGEFDAKVAKSIIDSKELYGDGKERLKGLIEQYERAQEAQKQFDEYVKNTFGELGTSVIDSVYNALQKGEDAFESFAKSVGNVIGKLGKQLAYELFIADHFKRLQEKITQAGKNNNGSEDFARQSSQIVSEFGNAMKSKVSEMQTFLKQWNEMGKANGFEFLNEQNRQATEKGFARMSQDTGEELNGQFRLQTQLSAEIKNAMLQSVKEFAEMHKFMQTSSAQQLRYLAGIEANTFQLHEMKKDIANMKAGISEITTKGIKIRS